MQQRNTRDEEVEIDENKYEEELEHRAEGKFRFADYHDDGSISHASRNLLRDLSPIDWHDRSGNEVVHASNDDGSSIMNLDGVGEWSGDGEGGGLGYGYQGTDVQYVEGKGPMYIPGLGIGNRGGKQHRLRPDEALDIKLTEKHLMDQQWAPSLKCIYEMFFLEEKGVDQIAGALNMKPGWVLHKLSIIESHLHPIRWGYTDHTFKDATEARRERGETTRRKL